MNVGTHETMQTASSARGKEVEEWLAARKQAAATIDADTAEISWGWGHLADPYGVYPDLQEEERQIGRTYFARSPGSDVWVSFRDLPHGVRERLWRRMASKEFQEFREFQELEDEGIPF